MFTPQLKKTKKTPQHLPALPTERSGTRRNYKLGLINYVSTICRSPPPPGLINGLNKMGWTHLLEGSNMRCDLGPRKNVCSPRMKARGEGEGTGEVRSCLIRSGSRSGQRRRVKKKKNLKSICLGSWLFHPLPTPPTPLPPASCTQLVSSGGFHYHTTRIRSANKQRDLEPGWG